MGRQVAFESTLESDFLTILASDTSLTSVLEQPVRLEFTDATGRARHYTPDFLATYGRERSTAVLYEIKFRADLRANWSRLKPGFVAARHHAHEHGMRFSIMTEIEIRGDYLANMRFLAAYRSRPHDAEIEEHLVRTVAVLGEPTAQEVLTAAYWDSENRVAAIARLWRLIAIGRIQADLSQRLTMDTPLWVIIGEGFL